MSRRLVKVVVPCYGYADQLGDCLRTVLEQEGVELQVLILDARSPDQTPREPAGSWWGTTGSSIDGIGGTPA